MNSIDPNNLPGSQESNKQEHVSTEDHPGNKEAVKNPNPRANENLPGADSPVDNKSEDTVEVGSEITDGEDG